MAAGSIIIDLLMRTGSFETDTARAEAQARRRARAISDAFDDMGRKIGIAAGAGAAALSAMIVSTANSAKELTNLAQISGASATEFQRFAAGAKSVGIEQDKLGDIFKDFREKVGEFVSTGGGGMKDFFEQVAPKIGVTADQFRNLSGPQALQLYYDSLQKANLSQEQMSFYLESMASDTTALIPLLRDGGKEMQALGDAAERTGRIMNEDAVNSAANFKKQLDEFQGILTGLSQQIASTFIPTLSAFAGKFLEIARDVGIAQAALITFGEKVALALGVDDLSKLSKEANNARFNIERLGRQLETANAMPFGAGAKAAESLRAQLDAEMKRAAQLSEQIKAITNPAAPALPISRAGGGRGMVNPAFVTPAAVTIPKVTTKTAIPKPTATPLEIMGPMPDIGMMEYYVQLDKDALQAKLSLMSEREKEMEQQARWHEMLKQGMITQDQLNQLMLEPVEQGYWEQWLDAAEGAVTSFDALASGVIQNFTSGFGNAFEQMIFDSATLGESISKLAEGMARSVVNALGQMAAQWLAYQVVQMVVGKTTAATAASAIALEAQASSVMAGINAFASTAAIPIVGPAMAPAAMGAALAVTQPMAASVAALSAAAAGARANGGPVSADQPYLVGERGPELFTPNRSGGIVPNNKLNNGGVTVNLIEDKSRAGQTETRANNGAQEIDVFVADIMGDGPRSKAMRTAFGLQRRGY